MHSPARRQPLWAFSLAAAAMVLAPAQLPAANPALASDTVPSDTGAGTYGSPARPDKPSLAEASARAVLASLTATDSPNSYSPEITARFERAAQLFERARAGAADAVGPAQDAFKDLQQTDSSNPLFVAYYGSTFAMRARDGGAPWQKIKWVNEAINNIDHALALLGPQYDAKSIRGVPISLETRLVAIATYIPLPSVFNRMSVARLQLAVAMGSPAFARASNELRGRLYYEDALIARSDGDTDHERRALREVVKNSPPSLNMDEIREQLAKLGG